MGLLLQGLAQDTKSWSLLSFPHTHIDHELETTYAVVAPPPNCVWRAARSSGKFGLTSLGMKTELRVKVTPRFPKALPAGCTDRAWISLTCLAFAKPNNKALKNVSMCYSGLKRWLVRASSTTVISHEVDVDLETGNILCVSFVNWQKKERWPTGLPLNSTWQTEIVAKPPLTVEMANKKSFLEQWKEISCVLSHHSSNILQYRHKEI